MIATAFDPVLLACCRSIGLDDYVLDYIRVVALQCEKYREIYY